MKKKFILNLITVILIFCCKNAYAEKKPFVFITASYNNSQWYEWNLNSVINQTYDQWRMIYIDDCSTDRTPDLVEAYIKKYHLENKIALIRNKTREGNPLANHYKTIHNCLDDEIVIILDGDDALAHPKVLSHLNRVYQNPKTWITYGQFMEYPSGAKGFSCPMPQHVVTHNAFRYFVHIPSHLRSFYAWLFKKIKKEDLLYKGTFFPMTGDMAAMIPMIEMARDHFLFIPQILYLYNATNPLNEHKIDKELQRTCDLAIRSRKRYTPLTTMVSTEREENLLGSLFNQNDYQDIVINGHVVKKGIRECSSTYQAIQPILNKYHRPITILDLGAAQGFFSFRIAAEYEATAVMIENSINYPLHNRQLLKLCELNNSLDNIIFLQVTITPQLLLRLGESEHFDIILALNFIHHCMHPWKKIIDALLTLGNNIIIEHPPSDENVSQHEKEKRKAIEEYLMQHNAKLLAHVPRHTSKKTNGKIFWIQKNKTSLLHRHWCWPPPYGADKKTHTIVSNYEEKIINKSNGTSTISSPWQKGINFMTFKMLHGVYPTKEMLKKTILDIKDSGHQDWTPANLVIQGKKIQLIDLHDFHYQNNLKKSNSAVQEQTLQLIDIDDPAAIYNFFWYTMFPKSTR